jgi:hypothetical protein
LQGIAATAPIAVMEKRAVITSVRVLRVIAATGHAVAGNPIRPVPPIVLRQRQTVNPAHQTPIAPLPTATTASAARAARPAASTITIALLLATNVARAITACKR